MVIDISEQKRKGIGYMIEGIIASVTLFIFAFGQTPAEPSQDWSTFQDEIAASDLSYTLKQTGDLNFILKRQHTGSLETAVSTITEDELAVSGTVENLPLNDASIGFTSTNHAGLQERHTDPIRDVVNGDRCYGDLEEIEQQTGTSIKRTEDPGDHDGVVLYLADTDPQVSGGTNSEIDYDTLYVDNQTRCQFSASEGPFYNDEFFRWNTSVSGAYEYYDLKNIDGDSNQLTYYNATLPFQVKKQMGKPINSIETTQTINTFNLDTANLNVYDLIVIRREQAIEYINANPDREQKIVDFMRNNPVLVISNLSKANVENGFIADTGLKWVDLSYSEDPNNYQFSNSQISRKLETYFEGSNGEILDLDLPTGGKIASSNSESITQDDPILYARDGNYITDPWNGTNYSMEQVDPDTINGKPESTCYNSGPSSALTKGTFSFPDNSSDSDIEYNVINAQMGTTGNCGVVRSLSIDLDNDGIYTEEGEGPFFSGERIILESKSYTIDATSSNSAEFVFSGNSNPEIVNYRSSFEGFRGDRLARLAYQEDYSEDSMKLISSTAYWLLGDTTQFGNRDESSVSTTVLGSINQNVYMPYKVSLRWR
jgi:hypothetical protein